MNTCVSSNTLTDVSRNMLYMPMNNDCAGKCEKNILLPACLALRATIAILSPVLTELKPECKNFSGIR